MLVWCNVLPFNRKGEQKMIENIYSNPSARMTALIKSGIWEKDFPDMTFECDQGGDWAKIISEKPLKTVRHDVSKSIRDTPLSEDDYLPCGCQISCSFGSAMFGSKTTLYPCKKHKR